MPRTGRGGATAPDRRASAKRQDAAFEELCSWIDFFGGHVHPKLDLGVTSLGCRGVITTDILTEADQRDIPVMAIPDSLTLSADLAAAQLEGVLTPRGVRGVAQLQPEIQVALYLAHERSKGAASRFAPYIATMPAAPSCGWLMPPDAVASALAAVCAAAEVPKWQRVMSYARDLYCNEILEAEDMMDALGLDLPEVEWALGQAVSRAYGSSPRLIPALDCVNHSASAQPPLTITNDDGATLTCVSNLSAAMRVQELDAGAEVLVSYASSKFGFEATPVEMFIDYAFVPEEMLEGGAAPALDDEDFDHLDSASELEGY